jgi:hypothetical protein
VVAQAYDEFTLRAYVVQPGSVPSAAEWRGFQEFLPGKPKVALSRSHGHADTGGTMQLRVVIGITLASFFAGITALFGLGPAGAAARRVRRP